MYTHAHNAYRDERLPARGGEAHRETSPLRRLNGAHPYCIRAPVASVTARIHTVSNVRCTYPHRPLPPPRRLSSLLRRKQRSGTLLAAPISGKSAVPLLEIDDTDRHVIRTGRARGLAALPSRGQAMVANGLANLKIIEPLRLLF